jgi:tetratricopeptide (TPR) repeat protein
MSTSSFEELLQTARRALTDGWVDEAKHLYEMACSQQPDSADAHYGLATSAFRLNDILNAAQHFKEVTRLDPWRAAAFVNLGAALTRMGEHGAAAEAIRKGMQLDPKFAGTGYYNLGLVYRAAGEEQRALQAFQEAVRLEPRSADVHFNLGRQLMQQGQFSRAVASLRKALELQPGYEPLAEALAQAEKALFDSRQPSPQPKAEDERRLNPEVDGPTLLEINKSIVAAQQASLDFLTALCEDLVPTVRDLRLTLIANPNSSGIEVDLLADKFAKAMARLVLRHEQLQDVINDALVAGERLV